MKQKPPKPPHNTREFLPATKQVQFVPMSADDFKRNRTRKIAIWTGIVVAVLAVMGIIVWSSSAPSSARNDFDDAHRMYTAGKYVEAVAALDSAIRGKIHLAESYQLRATLYRILNEPNKCIEDSTKAIELQPDNADNYKTRANAYRETGQYDRAVEDYNKLIQLQPTAVAYNGRGVCYRELKQPEKALEDFNKAVQMEPNIENLLQRGMVLDAIGRHKEAIADFDGAVERRPDTPYPYRARAHAREALGDKAGAAADREIARSIEFPNEPPPARAKK